MQIGSEETFALGGYIVSSKKGHHSARTTAGKIKKQTQKCRTSGGHLVKAKSPVNPTELQPHTLIKVPNTPVGHQEKVTFMLV